MSVIEFIGGPFDGYCQAFEEPSERLAETVALPVNENVFRMLEGQSRGPAQPTRTVALYERFDRDHRFFFTGSCLPQDFNLQDWRV